MSKLTPYAATTWPIRIKFHTAVLPLLLLVGCTSPPEPTAESIRAEMVGMSMEEISTCIGLPPKRAAEGKTEVWSYTYGTCILDLEIANNRVKKAVSYTMPTSEPPTDADDDPCAKIPVVASCTRWLRN